MYVVVDGCNLENRIVSNMASISFASCCSYECLYDYTFKLLSWMKSMNIRIKRYYDDMMPDMDKVQTDLDRKEERAKGSIKLIASMNENYEHGTPGGVVNGVGYPRMCIQCVKSAVDAFLRTEGKRGKRRCYACSDPDRYDSKRLVTCREIAKYAEMHKCYVLTGDYDFAVFPVKGIIDVSLILEAYDDVTDSILTIPRYKVLNALHLTDLKMRYVAVLCGNDFYPNDRYDHMKDISDNEDAAVCLEDFLDEEDIPASSSDGSDDEDTSASSSDESDEEDIPASSSDGSDDEDIPASSSDGSDDEDTSASSSDGSDDEDIPASSSDESDEEDIPASSSDGSDEEDIPASSSDGSDDEDTYARSSDGFDDEDTPDRSSDESDDEDTPLCLKDVDYRDRVSVAVKHIATLPSTKADLLDDCMTQFPKLSPSAIEERFSKTMLKYNTKAYPLFPQSCLPQSIDDDVFDLCGVSEGDCVPFPPSQILSGS